MTNLSPAAQSQALNSLDGGAANLIGFASLHTASPSTTGANETSGGGYARQAATWSSSSAGSAKTNSGALAWSTPGVTAVTDAGGFSLVTAGVFGVGLHLGSSVTAASITAASGALSLTAS